MPSPDSCASFSRPRIRGVKADSVCPRVCLRCRLVLTRRLGTVTMNRLSTVLGYPLRPRAHLLAAGVLALVLAACSPGVVQAETLSFTNDTNVPLVIQGAC